MGILLALWEKNNRPLVFVGAGEISTLGIKFVFREHGGASFWKNILILGLIFFHLQQTLEKDYISQNGWKKIPVPTGYNKTFSKWFK